MRIFGLASGLLVLCLAAGLGARQPSSKQRPAKNGKYSIASGADQVLSAVYDPTTNTLRVSGGLGGSGSVTSVGLSAPSIFNVAGSPVTGAGTLTLSLASQPANTVLAGPASGSAATPGFRALSAADLPAINLAGNGNGGVAGALRVQNGGTGLTGVGTSGQCLASSGVAMVWQACGAGTVTSVGLTLPSGFTATGSPVTTAGALGISMPAGWGLGSLLVGNAANSVVALPAGAAGQCLTSNGTTVAWGACGTGGSSPVFQVNGANAASQATLNFQSGGYIAVTNPSAGNIQFNFTGPLAVANGGTGLTTLGNPGQCLTSNGTTAAWGSCGSAITLQTNGANNGSQSGLNLVAGSNVTLSNTGSSVTISASSGGGSGIILETNGASNASQAALNLVAGSNISLANSGGNVTISAATGSLPSSWSVAGATNTVSAQPASGQDATTLTLAPSLTSGGTADIFDVCSTTPCSNGTKYLWVTYNGNLGFASNTWQLGNASQASQSYLRMYGGSTPNAPAYLDLFNSAGSARTTLFPSVSSNGMLCIGSAVPGGDCGPAVSGTNTVVTFASSGAAPATGDCAKWIGPNQLGDAGGACGSGGGGGTITLQTNGANNGSQSALNLVAGSNITLSDSGSNVTISAAGGGGGAITLQTNGANNGSQSALNLVAGSNITLSDSGSNVTISAAGGGGGAPAYAATTTEAAASTPVITMVTPSGNTRYRISFQVSQTVPTAGCSAQPSIVVHVTWTDALSGVAVGPLVNDFSAPGFQGDGSEMNTLTFASALSGNTIWSSPAIEIYAASGVPVTYYANYSAGTGCTTGATYAVTPVVTVD